MRRMAGLQRRFILLFSLLVLAVPLVAQAQEASEFELIAVSWWVEFDSGDLDALYAELASPTFQAVVTKQIFAQNAGMLRIQSGGPALSRGLVGVQPMTQDPMGNPGNFRYIRFLADHPAGRVYEDILLQEAHGRWLVYSMNILPATGVP